MSVKVKSTGGAGGSANVVNGLIESYLASTETVDANTFVEFISSLKGESANITEGSISISGNSKYGNTVKTSDSRILYVYSDYSNDIKYALLDHSTGKMIVRKNDSLKTCSAQVTYIDIIHITESTYLLLYFSAGMNCMLLTVNEDIVTCGNSITLSNTSTSFGDANTKMAKITDTKVFILYCDSSNNERGTIVTVSGTSLSQGTSQVIYTKAEGFHLNYIRCIRISDTKVFISNMYFGDNYVSNYKICSISGTTITVSNSSNLPISYSGNVNNPGFYNISDNYIIALYNTGIHLWYFDSNNGINVVCTEPNIFTDTHGVITPAFIHLSNNDYLIVSNQNYNNRYVVILIVTVIPESSIMTIKSYQITNINGKDFQYYFNIINCGIGLYTIIPKDDYYLNIQIGEEVNLVQIATSKIDGITKTKCTTETPGEVWVLNNAT